MKKVIGILLILLSAITVILNFAMLIFIMEFSWKVGVMVGFFKSLGMYAFSAISGFLSIIGFILGSFLIKG